MPPFRDGRTLLNLRHLGYVGQNLTLKETTGRTLRLANLTAERVREVTALNLGALRTILEWNVAHGIHFFRVGSSIVPFASHPAFPLDWRAEFDAPLADIRAFAETHDLRLSMHPGQYTVLNSPNPNIVTRAVAELEYHAQFLEAVDPGSGTMTLHIGGLYGEREVALARFGEGFARHSPEAQARLTLENDDKIYGIRDVLELGEALGIPVIFDLFHHKCNPGFTDWREDLQPLLERVVRSWGERVPKLHLSSPREPGKIAHADTIAEEDLRELEALMADVPGDAPYDVMLEAKLKDVALLKLLETPKLEA